MIGMTLILGWSWLLNEETEVGHVQILNRADYCGERLNNVNLLLYDSSGQIIYEQILGLLEDVKDVSLRGSGQFCSVTRGLMDCPFRPMLAMKSRVKFHRVIPWSLFCLA